jgi:hypothetical protein
MSSKELDSVAMACHLTSPMPSCLTCLFLNIATWVLAPRFYLPVQKFLHSAQVLNAFEYQHDVEMPWFMSQLFNSKALSLPSLAVLNEVIWAMLFVIQKLESHGWVSDCFWWLC